MSFVPRPEYECLNMEDYYYKNEKDDQECLDQWSDWDQYCSTLSAKDYEGICVPELILLAHAIEPETKPNEEVECLNDVAYNWSDDYCGQLWRSFDEWCQVLSDADIDLYVENCLPVIEDYLDAQAEALKGLRQTVFMKKVAAKSSMLLASSG